MAPAKSTSTAPAAAAATTAAATTPKAPVATGLGDDVDKLAAKSPSLQTDMQSLKDDGWKFRYGTAGGGTFANRTDKEIVVDMNEKGHTADVVQSLSHEVGHAKYPYVADYSSKGAYVTGTLADEGAATMNNIRVQREVLANGGPDIGMPGDAANHADYIKAYDQYLKDGNADACRQAIGNKFGAGEVTSTTGQPYADYYGSWYDKTFPPKK